MDFLCVRRFALTATRCRLVRFRSRAAAAAAGGPPGDTNILLMGPPGAGKTTVGRIVARRLGLPAIDVDDDVLEPAWRMPVAAMLASLGGERFLEEEAKALCNFSASGAVVSLTGSNPLSAAAMRHVKRTGVAVYLDVDPEDILGRLARMKVERVVGQEAGRSMRDILNFRKRFYERWLDVRVLCGSGDSEERVADKVVAALARYHEHAADAYVSTRGGGGEACFSDAVVEGLAPDGGLYVPRRGFPKLDVDEWRRLVAMSYVERALVLLERCIHPLDVSPADLRQMVERAYGGANFSSQAVAPVRRLSDGQLVLELFHGPTASFKDLALQLMPQLFAHCLPPTCSFLILVATSGDTGGAVLSGFGRLGGADARRTGVLVFFPEDGVSEVQKLQMTGFRGGNVRAVGVRSDFDFCQRSIKRMLGGAGLGGHLAAEYATVLSTANSINWARLLPQVVYHSSAYLSLCRDGVLSFGDPVDVCIPTGNFGNAMSAVYAKQMGVPIRRIICASNQNRVISDFINTGVYDLRGRRLMPSRSPAIDILKSSNLERFLHHVSHGDGPLVQHLFSQLELQQHFRLEPPLLRRVQQEVLAGCCSEDDCLDAIRHVHARTGYLMDPHTAVGHVVAERLRDSGVPLLLVATAHPDKFAPDVLRALRVPDVPEDAAEQLRMLQALASVPATHGDVMRCVAERGGAPHTVCGEDYGELVGQVEDVIEDCFLKVM